MYGAKTVLFRIGDEIGDPLELKKGIPFQVCFRYRFCYRFRYRFCYRYRYRCRYCYRYRCRYRYRYRYQPGSLSAARLVMLL